MKFSSARLHACIAAAAMALLAACDGGGGGGTGSARPSNVAAASTTEQVGVAGALVDERPAVRVTDASGQPVANVAVQFAVTQGGGTVTGASATTNAAGIATVGDWLLGATPGMNALTATVSNVGTVQFTADGADPCELSDNYELFTTVQGTLGGADCRYATGEYVDRLDLHLPQAAAVTFTMSSASVDAFLVLEDPFGNVVAFNDDDDFGSTFDSALRVFAPAGGYRLRPTSYDAGETGSYTIGSASFAGNEDCGEYWVVPGVAINGSLTATDCDFGYLTDEYAIQLYAGETMRFVMESDDVDAFVALYDGEGTLVASNDDASGTTLDALLDYTVPATGVYYVDATTALTGEAGQYTLTVMHWGNDRAPDARASARAPNRVRGKDAAPPVRAGGPRKDRSGRID